jgi:putative transposase
MDEARLAAAARYVVLNPAPSRLVDRAGEWRWSSAKAHLIAREEGVTLFAPVLDRLPRVACLLEDGGREEPLTALRRAGTIGRPLENEALLAGLETTPRRAIRAKPRGPKLNTEEQAESQRLAGLPP